MANKAVYLAIYADRRHNKLMKAADLFEAGKVLGFIRYITITYEPDIRLTLRRSSLKTIHLEKALTEAGSIVTFVHLLYIESNGKKRANTGYVKPYVNRDIRVISTGAMWYLFDEYLRRIGFEVKTNGYRYIESVK